MDDDPTGQLDPNVVPFRHRVDKQARGHSPSPDPLQEVLTAIDMAVKEADWSPDYRDAAALQDEHVFWKRFGFDANRRQRRQIIAFKHQADVTDAEIRILRKSGSLVYRDDGVEILAPAVIAAWGHVQIVALGLLMILPVLKFGLKPEFSWPIFSGVVLVEVVLVYLVKLSDDIYIRPHRIRKRVLQQSTTAGAMH